MFMAGFGCGLFGHIGFQDAVAYDQDTYMDLVVKMKSRQPNNWKQALCLAIYNDNVCCPGKEDPRWENSSYWGECELFDFELFDFYIGTGLVNPQEVTN